MMSRLVRQICYAVCQSEKGDAGDTEWQTVYPQGTKTEVGAELGSGIPPLASHSRPAFLAQRDEPL